MQIIRMSAAKRLYSTLVEVYRIPEFGRYGKDNPLLGQFAIASVRRELLLTLVVLAGFVAGDSAAIAQIASSIPSDGDATAPQDPTPEETMLAAMRKRLAQQPEHSDTWRLIGRLERKTGNLAGAIEATAQALFFDPLNAAAHFDFAELMILYEDPELANHHRQQVFIIAPNSSYATQLTEAGFRPEPDEVRRGTEEIKNNWGNQFTVVPADERAADDTGGIQLAGYEIQTLDGADDLERELNRINSTLDFKDKPLRFFLESGVQYNTNVSLTPISRELADSDAASAQFFVTPELEWTLHQQTDSRFGPLLRGNFTVNEGQWSSFNLASFQPGAFWEKEFSYSEQDLIGRIDYVYSLDIIGGDRLGDRHSITTSLINIRPDLDVIYCYLTTSFSQFDDDGADASVSSLDGTSVTAGISRFFQTDFAAMPTWSVGMDLENADTEGSNFRYNGITFHTSSRFQLNEKLSFLPEAGVGSRTYPDFTGPVNRDEVTWRVGARLRWQHNQQLSTSIVARHDRFASDNEDFDAERSQIGIVTTFLY